MTTETWPGYTPEAQAYELSTRPTTDLSLTLNAVEAIRLHGLITTHVEKHRKKLALLIALRGTITPEPDISEEMLGESIRDFDRVLARLTTILYGEKADE